MSCPKCRKVSGCDCVQKKVITKQGERGPQGGQGPPGRQGRTGDPGAQGPIGPAGADGAIAQGVKFNIQPAGGLNIDLVPTIGSTVNSTYTATAATPADLNAQSINTSNVISQPIYAGGGGLDPNFSMLIRLNISLNTSETVPGTKPVVDFALDLTGILSADREFFSQGVEPYVNDATAISTLPQPFTARMQMSAGVLNVRIIGNTGGNLINFILGTTVVSENI